jgi:molybdopterin/thiamine biosynthesis adenylyltransferase
MDDRQLLRYGRHLLLEEIGLDGQERLLNATALVVGAGGLGSPAALYLAGAGIGRLILADGDVVELSNLQRQILHREDSVGLNKAESGQRSIAALNPEVEVVPVGERLSGEALDAAVAQADVVLDCSDNFATRQAVNRACVRHGVPLVSGAAIRFDGQLAVFAPAHEDSPCYHCIFPEDQAPEEVRCAVMGVFAPLTGLIGTMQASEALKLVGGFGEPAIGRLLMIDLKGLGIESIALSRDPLCRVCAARPARRPVPPEGQGTVTGTPA